MKLRHRLPASMTKDENDSACMACGSKKHLTFAIVLKKPSDTDESPLKGQAYISEEPRILCHDHFDKLAKGDEYYVRELAPVPETKGGFKRTTNEEADVVYDKSISNDAWIEFDSEEFEIDLTRES